MKRVGCVAGFAAVLLLGGCSPSKDATESSSDAVETGTSLEELAVRPPEPVGAPSADSGASVVPPPPPAAIATGTNESEAIEVQAVDLAGLEGIIAKHQGKQVVIDCWATWCTNCKAKFPKFVELSEKYKGKDGYVFANMANDPEDKIDEVKDFLGTQNADLVNILLDIDPADFAEHFDVAGVPAYLLYGPDGKLSFRTNKLEELEAKLAEAAPASP